MDIWTYPFHIGGIVILGGIKSIARVASYIVPFMCGIYLLACFFIIGSLYEHIPFAINLILKGIYSRCCLWRFPRSINYRSKTAVFSNEAGIGSAAIAHSAAKVSHPVEEGIVALLEPFIDTILVCTMTALVIILTGAYGDPANADFIANNQGGALTSAAMASVILWFPYILSMAVFLFAFSTMISWSYYGERCWVWLFGDRSSYLYKCIFFDLYLFGIDNHSHQNFGFFGFDDSGYGFSEYSRALCS